MTSLELLPSIERQYGKAVPDWGTGKPRKEKINLSIDNIPTYLHANLPIEQYYDLTQLKRSNLRPNDELTPRPTEVDMSSLLINLPFPAEHPYASHEPRYSVIPRFTENPGDLKTGLQARSFYPKPASVPARPNDVQVVSKMIGKPYKHEIMSQPADSHKLPLQWPGDIFDQYPKTSPEQSLYYPIPPQLVSPNMTPRIPQVGSVTPRTANCLHNLERDQWRTHYSREFSSALGTSSPVQLDNLEEKRRRALENGGLVDDTLKPSSSPTFDPPRPVQGRIARSLDTRMRPFRATFGDPTPEEINQMEPLPEDEVAKRWRQHKSGLAKKTDRLLFSTEMSRQEESEPPHMPMRRSASALGMVSTNSEQDNWRRVHKESLQQMEAEDRWRVLDAETPDRDIQQLRNKFSTLSHVDQQEAAPRIFYDHEGRYQEERAGLYRTSYLPEHLRYRLSGGETHGLTLTNTSRSHEDALAYPSQLNRELRHHNVGYFGTSPYPPYSGDKLDYDESCSLDRRHYLQPFPHEASPRVQEGGRFNETYSEKTDNYDTSKFLQEHQLSKWSRLDPGSVFSAENGLQLSPLRDTSPLRRSRSVHFADDVTVAHMNGTSPPLVQLSSQPLNDSAQDPLGNYLTSRFQTEYPVTPREPVTHQLDRASLGLSPSPTWQSPVDRSSATELHLGYKDYDPRFQWRPDSGLPRPVTKLGNMQKDFDKTAIRRQFYYEFPESNPDLRENVINGRRHLFGGFNSQFLHG